MQPEKLNQIRQEVRTELILRDPEKYRKWLTILRYSQPLMRGPQKREKAAMFECDYLWMRVIDDIADGDMPIPYGYSTSSRYVESKLEFLHNPGLAPRDSVEELMDYCGELSVITGINLTDEREQIVESMLFDADRFGSMTVFSQEELDWYFSLCDDPILDGTLKLVGYDPDAAVINPIDTTKKRRDFLVPLKGASRKYHNMRDLEKNILKKGFVDISGEDCEGFEIRSQDLLDINSGPMRAWMLDQSLQGEALLAQHRLQFPRGNFYLWGRLFAQYYHAQPSQRFFERVIKVNQDL